MSQNSNVSQSDDNQPLSVEERSKRRQEASMDQPIADIFYRLVNADAQAAEKLRNTLIETNPRLAWRLTAQLPTKDRRRAGVESASARRVIQEAEEGPNLAHRGFRETVLEGGWLKVSAMSAAWPSSAQTRQAREKVLTPPSGTSGRVVRANTGATDKTPRVASGSPISAQNLPTGFHEESVFGSRSAFRLGLWAVSQNQRQKETFYMGRATDRGGEETRALMELAPPVLRGPFSEGDAMAFLRLLAGPGVGMEKKALSQTLVVNAAPGSPGPALVVKTPNEKEQEWTAQVAAFAQRKISIHQVELVLQEALAARKPRVAKAAAALVKSLASDVGSAGLGHSGPRGNDVAHAGDSAGFTRFSWDAREGFQQFNNNTARPLREGGRVESVHPSAHALSIAQGLGWRWLTDAGVALTPSDMRWISRNAKLNEFTDVAHWLAESFAAARERAIAIENRCKKEAAAAEKAIQKEIDAGSDPKTAIAASLLPKEAKHSGAEQALGGQWAGWGASGAPKGALSVEKIVELAPLFGGDKDFWRLAARSASLQCGQSVREVALACRSGDEFDSELAKGLTDWAKRVENDPRQTRSDTDGRPHPMGHYAPLLREALGAPFPKSWPLDALMPFRRGSVMAGVAESDHGYRPRTERLIQELIGRAWLSEWVGERAWAGFAPKEPVNELGFAARMDESEYFGRRAQHIQRVLLVLAHDLARGDLRNGSGLADPVREKIALDALKKAPDMDFWCGGRDVPGMGPLNDALAAGRWELAALWAASEGNERMTMPCLQKRSVSKMTADGVLPLTQNKDNEYSFFPNSAKAVYPSDSAPMGVCGMALLGGKIEIAKAAKKLARGAFDRDLEQLVAWGKLGVANDKSREILEIAIAQGEALALDAIKFKKAPAPKGAKGAKTMKNDTPPQNSDTEAIAKQPARSTRRL